MRHVFLPLIATLYALPAWAEAPKVVTDIAPVHSLVTMVMGDRGTAELLLPAGGDPHDFQLRPSQALALSEAGLVIWVGPALSPWLERSLDGVDTKAVRLELLAAPETVKREVGGKSEHGNEGHDHGDIEPHAWLSPQNGRIWLGLIAEALAKADPEGADIYRDNAKTGGLTINAAEKVAGALLAPVKDRPFAVLHDAYGYYADHFGLTVAGTVRMGDAAQPGAAHLRALEADLRASGAVCIFPEANHSMGMVEQIAQAAGLRLGGVLDPAGVNMTSGATLYPVVIVGLAQVLADCLSGD